MTTIAWDGKTLAADRQLTDGNLLRAITKIRATPVGLIGSSGTATLGRERVQWVIEGAIPDVFPKPAADDESSYLVVITPDGKINYYADAPYPLRIEDKNFAIGSGRDFALASMYLGLSAPDGVHVAMQFDSGTGMGVDTLTLEDIPKC